MHIEFKDLDKANTYRLLTHAVIPRPVAWVLTQSDSGTTNIAPFSYFSALCSDPALVMISVGYKRDGAKKDTWLNIETSKQAVIHIADKALLNDLNQTAISLPHNHSELNEIQATTIAQADFTLPRVEAAPIALNCQLHDIHMLGNGPQAIIYLEVVSAFVDDRLAITDNYTFDAKALDPIARLGGDGYSALGEVFRLVRP